MAPFLVRNTLIVMQSIAAAHNFGTNPTIVLLSETIQPWPHQAAVAARRGVLKECEEGVRVRYLCHDASWWKD